MRYTKLFIFFIILTHFMPPVLFYTPWKQRFSDLFRSYRKRPVTWNGLNSLFSIVLFGSRYSRMDQVKFVEDSHRVLSIGFTTQSTLKFASNSSQKTFGRGSLNPKAAGNKPSKFYNDIKLNHHKFDCAFLNFTIYKKTKSSNI